MPILSLSSLSSINRLLSSVVCTEVDLFVVNPDKGSPPLSGGVYPLVPASVGGFLSEIPHIFGASGLSKIIPAVVSLIAVDVVNFVRPSPFNYGENDAVSLDGFIVHSEIPVPVTGADVASSISGVFRVPGFNMRRGFSPALPDKYPIFRAVVEKLSESVNVRLSHVDTSYISVVRGLDIGVSSTPHSNTMPPVATEVFA